MASPSTFPSRTSLYRPAVRQRCRDGFLPLCRAFAQPAGVSDPAKLETVVAINGGEVRRYRFDDLYRPLPELIAEISAFMSFQRGDVLLVGLAPDGATAAAGDEVTAAIAGVGQVACRLEAAP
jgi:5-oxopent-3-ene-1,2,5-tricarboxylate decarboxylase / 2-hydroxyhepta-2,4-diene-1,7-dioate isomerase